MNWVASMGAWAHACVISVFVSACVCAHCETYVCAYKRVHMYVHMCACVCVSECALCLRVLCGSVYIVHVGAYVYVHMYVCG